MKHIFIPINEGLQAAMILMCPQFVCLSAFNSF